MSKPTKMTYLPERCSPSMDTFHLDECMDGDVSPALCRQGFDVTTTAERGLSGVSDPRQLAFATRERRILITRDRDFVALHRSGHRHAGIVFCPSGRLSTTRLANFLAKLQCDVSCDEGLTLDDILDAVLRGVSIALAILAGAILALVLLR